MASIKKVHVEVNMNDGFAIESNVRGHVARIDQPVQSGGTDSGPTPLEYLLLSLAGCVCTIGRIIANQRRLPVRSISARVEGELDIDVLLGKSNHQRAGFSGLKVIADIDADMTLDEKKHFLHEIDKRCPISDNLQFITPVTLEVEETVPDLLDAV